MTTARARRFVLIALIVSLVAFLGLSAWGTTTWGRVPAVGLVLLVAVTFGGIACAQVLTLDLFKGDPKALVKASALQPAWPFLVFLIGVTGDEAIRVSLGRSTAGEPITTALVLGAGLGIVGIGLLAGRVAVGAAARRVMAAG